MAETVKRLPQESTRTWVQTLGTHLKSQACAWNPSNGKVWGRVRWVPGSSQVANLVYMANEVPGYLISGEC